MAGAFGGLLFCCRGVEASSGEPLGVAILLQLIAPHK
jgi:hypothetical protein